MLTRETPKPRIVARTLLALLALAFVLSLPSQAQSESAIYDFVAPGHDGHTPNAGVVSDAAGNLYGTTVLGGTHNSGTVFELSPVTGGGWSETVIYSFTGGLDGGAPETPVILAAAGNVYGTAVGQCLWQHATGRQFHLERMQPQRLWCHFRNLTLFGRRLA